MVVEVSITYKTEVNSFTEGSRNARSAAAFLCMILLPCTGHTNVTSAASLLTFCDHLIVAT